MGSENGLEGAALEAGGVGTVELAPETPPRPQPHGLARVEGQLRDSPWSFEFFRAVALLERIHPERAPVGGFADPAHEVVRFSVNPAISFPPSEIFGLKMPEDGPARMSVNFMGLTGPQGVLPLHYSLLISERRRARDPALGDFLDLFHHRILSLFYRAWGRSRFTVGSPRIGEGGASDHLLDLVGMGLERHRRLLPFSDDALAFFAGLFAPQPRGAVALEQLLEDFFGVPARVEQFVGGWYRLHVRDQCALGEELGAAEQLGLGAVAGDEIWDPQARIRVRLGPLPRERYDSFLPTGSAYEPLHRLVRFFCHDQFDFDVQLVLARDDVPGLVLGADDGGPQTLGWTTWIRSAAFPRDADDTILAL